MIIFVMHHMQIAPHVRALGENVPVFKLQIENELNQTLLFTLIHAYH